MKVLSQFKVPGVIRLDKLTSKRPFNDMDFSLEFPGIYTKVFDRRQNPFSVTTIKNWNNIEKKRSSFSRNVRDYMVDVLMTLGKTCFCEYRSMKNSTFVESENILHYLCDTRHVFSASHTTLSVIRFEFL